MEELISHRVVPTLATQFHTLWEVAQLRAIWQVAGYIYFYGIFQIPNSAMTTFLIEGLGFTDFEYGMLAVAGYAVSWLGLVLYRAFFFDSSWRDIYVYTTLIGSLLSLVTANQSSLP